MKQPRDLPEATDETGPLGGLLWFQRPPVSLAHPQYRLFWISNLLFATGLMVQFTARGWLTVQLTDSPIGSA